MPPCKRRTKKNLPEQARALVGDDSRPVVLMAQDEGRFGRISEARRCWAPAGVRPTCPRQVVRESLYVFAAIAPASGEMSALILPHCDTQAMNLFLQTLSGEFAGRLVLLQTDRAGWHQSAALQLPDNVRLFYQPSHSPELNPVEHLWDDLREKALANRAFGSLHAVQDALVERLRELWAEPQALHSMTAFPWFKL
jgi:DDE superfamily endonuclease